MTLVGAQLTISTGLDVMVAKAAAAGLNTVQIFSRNPVGGQSRGLPPNAVCRTLFEGAGIRPLFVHAPYFVNPAAVKADMQSRAEKVLREEMHRVRQLGGDFLVLHPGHRQIEDPRSGIEALARTVSAMLAVPGKVLIENAAGQGREQGADFAELSAILNAIGSPRRVGLLLDTAHAMAAGHPLASAGDVRALLAEIEQTVGLNRIKAIHLNDNPHAIGSRRDRHAHLLEGQFQREGLRVLLQYAQSRHWPVILETPGQDPESRAEDLRIIRELIPPVLVLTPSS